MVTQATQIQYNYNMIEDYALTVWPPVAQDVEHSFLTLQNATGKTPVDELLTVSHQNQLLHFFRDPSSHSGWGQEERLVDGAPDQPITKLIGFYQGGTLFALAHYATSGGSNKVIGMQKTPERGWAAMPMTSNLTNALGAMRETDMFIDAKGTAFVYGVSEQFNQPTFVMLTATSSSKEWGLVFEAPAASGATYRLLPGQGGEQVTVMTLEGPTATFRGGSVVEGMFEWGSQPAVSHDLGQGELAAQQVFPIPSQSGDPGFLLLSNAGTLYHIEGYLTDQPSVVAMTGGTNQPAGAQQVSVGLDSQSRWMVFIIGTASNHLWLLRQSQGSVAAGQIAFDNWVALGNELAAIACPPVMTAGPELFFYDLKAQVCHMAQNLTAGDSTWFTVPLATPAAATANPTPTTTYTQELIAQDDRGMPAPKSPMTLVADRKTTMVANGISYHIGPNEPVLVESDARGKVTVATDTTALSASQFRATVAGSKKAAAQTWYRADLRVHERLAGKDSSFPVTGASLKTAGLLPKDMSGSDADSVAKTIRTLGGAAVHLHATGNAAPAAGRKHSPAPPDACFEIDFTQPGRMVYRDLDPKAWRGQAVAIPSDAIGGWFSDIVGDIVHFFKHAVDEVKTIVVHIVDGVANLVINGMTYALNTINEIADAIELVVKKVAALVKKVIDVIKLMIEWLRMLFDWSDILNTHTVIKYYVNSVFTNIKSTDEDAIKRIKKDFSTLKSKITSAIGNAENVFGSGSFNDFISKQKGGSSSSLAGQKYHDTFNAHAVRCNYVMSKSEHFFASATSLGTTLAAPATADPFAQFEAMLKQQVDGLQASTEKLQDFLQIKGGGLTKFFDSAVVDFLQAAEIVITFVLGVIEDIVVALLDLVGTAITTLQKGLNANIDIPIVSWLYKYVITGTVLDPGDDLTLLDLLSLIIAIPATILYKVLFGGSGAKAPFTSEQVSAITSNPIPWPSVGASAGAKPAEPAAAPGPTTATQEVLLALAALSYFLYTATDVGIDGYAASGATDDPLASFLSVSAIVLGLAIQGFTVPYQAMEDPSSEADIATITYWAVLFAPILLNSAFTAATRAESRFLPIVGPIASSICGMFVLGTGVWTTVEQALDPGYQNGWTEAANVIAPIPTTCAWLLPLTDATDGISAGTLMLIAAACDLGALVTTVGGMATSS